MRRVMKAETCTHVQAETATHRSDVCEDCGGQFSLRLCVKCGYVGCWQSQRAHDTEHFRKTDHAVIKSLPLTEASFTWCYKCDRYV